MTDTMSNTVAVERPTRPSGNARWFRLAVLVLAGGTIFKLANLKDAFYVPMQEQFGLTNTQIGVLLSVNAIVCTVLYVFGGFLADRFSTRFLIPAGLIGLGSLGVFMSTFPGYNALLAVFALLAVCSDCVVWPALLKAVRHLGGSDEQARMFGFLEAGRGVVDTVIAFSALGVFALLGSGAAGFRAAILFYAVIDIVVGVLVFFLLRDQSAPTGEPAEKVERAGWGTILKAARMPELWAVSATVFMVYIVYCGLTYFIPYMKTIYDLPVALVGAYGIVNQYALKILGGTGGGFLADKVFRSSSRYISWAFLAFIVGIVGVMLLPVDPAFQVVAVVCTLLVSLVVFTMRGVFWAPMEEVGIPEKITGTAFGIASLVGYAPGMFAYIIYGAILDANPGATGFRIVFASMAGLALIGAGVATLLHRMARRQRAVQPA